MKYHEVTTKVIELCKDSSLDFQAKTKRIQSALDACATSDILNHLDHGGIIPECFRHDSTEEKVFAKYCDALLAKAWCEMGLDAHVIEERADAADVTAVGNGYTIVGDAKAFRLSRTAKNQKDFKVEALDKWRKGADFACLVCPLYQYPGRHSQIYLQAVRYNVTLLSYTHLSFMIRNKSGASGIPDELRNLWELGKTLTEGKSATAYWSAVDKVMLELTGKQERDWKKAIKETRTRLPQQAKEQIRYWETEKARISQLPYDVVVKELIKALKIDAKIARIRKTVS